MATSFSKSPFPQELLSTVLGQFPVAEMVGFMTVCTRWRAIIIDHPEYWQRHVLESSALTHITGFVTRINRAHGRPIEATILLPREQNSATYINLIKTLQPHFSQLTILRIYFNFNIIRQYIPALFNAPALRLVELELVNTPIKTTDQTLHGPRVHVVLGDSWFGNNTPNLTKLRLTNIGLGGTPIGWLGNVSTFSYALSLDNSQFSRHSDGGAIVSLDAIMHLLPRVRSISFHGYLRGLACPPGYRTWSFGDRLICLDVANTDTKDAWVGETAHLDRVSEVRYDRLSGHAAASVADAFGGLFDVVVTDQEDEPDSNIFLLRRLDTSFTGTRTKKRIFRDAKSRWMQPLSASHGLFYAPFTSDRLRGLSLPAQLWCSLAKTSPQLRALQTLVITLVPVEALLDSVAATPNGKATCPSLKKIAFAHHASVQHGSSRPSATLEPVVLSRQDAVALMALTVTSTLAQVAWSSGEGVAMV
ncbi:hypothetical protein BKA62DRAFT_703394 [Auriculariales sp. MPI-PUGE-AT-0066]|nr:hypothetical protein BKA62DRAFT_703394 [Auriculariales sp. MPI-PUGE-AT-0066]